MPWSHEVEQSKVKCSKSQKEFDYSVDSFSSCRECFRECTILLDDKDRIVHSYNKKLEGDDE